MRKLKFTLLLMLAFIMIFPLQPKALAAVSDTGFADVEADAWYASAVEYCIRHDLMSGTSASIFSPDIPMSRVMLADALYRMEGKPKIMETSGFSDVAQDASYADAVAWAAQNGIVSGYGSGLFGINDPVTREQAATILWRYSGSPISNDTVSAFSDTSDISAYTVSAVNWARSLSVVSGKPGNLFDPRGNVTRAEAATILWNYLSVERPVATSQSTTTPQTSPQSTTIPNENGGEESAMINISITVGNSVFSAELYNNDTTKALLAQFPMTLNMGEMNGNEKYYNLPNRLPTASEQVGSIKTGDLMLYGSDCLVLFYKSFSTSYSYTQLGRVQDASGLADALGRGSVEVTFRAD